MRDFVHTAQRSRVVFGSGTLATLADEIDRLGCRRAFLLVTPRQEGHAQQISASLGSRAAGIFAGAVMHTPLEVTERALAAVRASAADCTVAIGGGSPIGLGKAIALRTDLPQICVPTTYAGSEMTPILGETRDGLKVTQRSPRILPEAVIYDVDLTLGLSRTVSGASGINGIAHAVEALYADNGNPLVSLMAEEAIAALARALPRVAERPRDPEARSDALYGAWLGGTCLGAVGMALHHKLCHVLGGLFDLPHAETHAVVLPYAIRYNASAAPEAMDRIARALGAADAAEGTYALARKLGLRPALRDLGMPEDGIERAATLAMEAAYPNPRPVEPAPILDLLKRAWAGDPTR